MRVKLLDINYQDFNNADDFAEQAIASWTSIEAPQLFFNVFLLEVFMRVGLGIALSQPDAPPREYRQPAALSSLDLLHRALIAMDPADPPRHQIGNAAKTRMAMALLIDYVEQLSPRLTNSFQELLS